MVKIQNTYKLKNIKYFSVLIFVISLQTLVGIKVTYAELGQPILIEQTEFLEQFFKALDERKKGLGRVRITHVGDSHIIADFWTGEMRTLLQKRFGDGGRGFVLGGKMWSSYSQHHIFHKSEGDWEMTNLKRGRDSGIFGPGGAALICAHSSCVTQIETRSGQPASQFDHLEVYTFGNSQGGNFTLTVDGINQGVFRTFSPWLTVKRHQIPLNFKAHQVQLSPLENQGEVWLFGFSLENSKGGLIYDSIGLNGSQAKHLLKNSDHHLRHAFQLLDSQLLVLSFGINEIFDRNYDPQQYYQELEALLSALRPTSQNSTLPACLLTGPFTALRGSSEIAGLQKMYEIQRKLSQRYRCALWDARAAMGGNLKPWQRKKLARRDGVHLSRHGYQRIATLFYESLLMSWEQWHEQTSHQTRQLSSTPTTNRVDR